MIDVRAPKPLDKAIGTRRETQRHLDCLARQIAARAGRQAIPVKVRSRARRRFSPRLYYRSWPITWLSNGGANSTRSH
ncbi:hypothetical protein [Rhizobium glycinendophyticum]|uniref:hypothetical protein n=1 Tax=Rhizobium glycinendophyticum TaxID=2589807 RepID=UPI001FE8C2C9|nr:hypothetical protein [Rhizobium glycinendophyticum]